MIAVTRLNGHPLIVNAGLIRTVEARPDTYLTLTDGERLILQDTPEEVVAKVIEYQRRVRLIADAA